MSHGLRTLASEPALPPVAMWPHAAVIARNNFVYKSLSNWAFNIAVGCSHGCSFCYVPSAATIKQTPKLNAMGVSDPDLEWGGYLFVREWNEERFLASLRVANNTPLRDLPRDGNRAVMYCSTTDPYQIIHHPDPTERQRLSANARYLVTRSLELILATSDLNVRILTRSPLARLDFEQFKQFKNRLVFGMSIPSLDDRLARVYEPLAPSPTKRLETLEAAKEAGLHVYVAVAPTYPECDAADLERTLKAIGKLDPITIFHEPINVRAENVQRISRRARTIGVKLKTEVFDNAETWQDYALDSFREVHRIARDLRLSKQLHLWPDKSLGSAACVARRHEKEKYLDWLRKCWSRVSEWPR